MPGLQLATRPDRRHLRHLEVPTRPHVKQQGGERGVYSVGEEEAPPPSWCWPLWCAAGPFQRPRRPARTASVPGVLSHPPRRPPAAAGAPRLPRLMTCSPGRPGMAATPHLILFPCPGAQQAHAGSPLLPWLRMRATWQTPRYLARPDLAQRVPPLRPQRPAAPSGSGRMPAGD